ncbi:CS domain protein [Oesophagostomum dentatum]|uniref:CS domain protein n=1 Tax=Oesophagostomum dentatum TaxID=61180 RepID=A0A0B1SCL3_OESDE|nr:CS domain protein [Oesophagostomum dentatum]
MKLYSTTYPLPCKIEEISDAEAAEFEKKHGEQHVVSSSEEAETKKNEVEKSTEDEDEEDKISCGQTVVRIPFKVGFPLKSRDLEVTVEKTHLRVALKGHPPVIDGPLFKEMIHEENCESSEIKTESSAWVLEDKKVIVISFEKVRIIFLFRIFIIVALSNFHTYG